MYTYPLRLNVETFNMLHIHRVSGPITNLMGNRGILYVKSGPRGGCVVPRNLSSQASNHKNKWFFWNFTSEEKFQAYLEEKRQYVLIWGGRYELRRRVRGRTRAMCGRRCACEIHSGKCAECVCVRPFFGRAMCDRTFAHFLTQNYQIMQLFALKTILELECPIPF